MIDINGVKVTKVSEILYRLNYAIKQKQPFGLLRFGDGGIKLISAFFDKDYDQILDISKQEGIPIDFFKNIVEFWKTSANHCDYIDTLEVYFSDKFWNRTKSLKKKKMSEKTIKKLKKWKELYEKVGIINTNYCNPEFNFLSCIVGRKSLPDLLVNKKICCITSRSDLKEKLSKYDIDIIKVNGKNHNQYHFSFVNVIEKINKNSEKYDLWLIAAGELGRIYTGLIKFKGGRAIDIGSVVDFWCTGYVPSRLQPYLKKTIHHPLKLILTKEGKEYSRFI